LRSKEPKLGLRISSHHEPAKLPGGVVIEGFPELGLAGTIASGCLVSSLKLALVGEIFSDYFPPLASVINEKLQAPARIYADAQRNIAIFLGDFNPGPRASHLLARAIVDWARKKECGLILTWFSTPMGSDVDEHVVSAVGNSESSEALVRKALIPLERLAVVGGVAASLLLEGKEAGMPVIALLVKTHKEIQDFEGGLKLAEAIMRLVPNANCDLEAIRGEAEATEANLRRIRVQTAPSDVYK
jgi:uncharacterized protein